MGVELGQKAAEGLGVLQLKVDLPGEEAAEDAELGAAPLAVDVGRAERAHDDGLLEGVGEAELADAVLGLGVLVGDAGDHHFGVANAWRIQVT